MRSLFYMPSVGFLALLAGVVSAAGSSDAVATRKLQFGLDFMKDRQWPEAAELLQYCLDRDDAVVTWVMGANGKPMQAPVHAAAERILALYQDGRPAYEMKYGRAARDLLDKAGDKDEKLLGEVARRFLFTKAGAVATEKLLLLHFNAARYIETARHSERLAQSTGLKNVPAETLFKAARAFHIKGDDANRDRFWMKLREQAPKGFQLGDRTLTLQEAEKELKKPARR